MVIGGSRHPCNGELVGQSDSWWRQDDEVRGNGMPPQWIHKFVIYRVDHFLEREGRDWPKDLVTIKEVVDTEAEAIAEVQRLQALKNIEMIEYLWQSAKYYPGGR